MLLKSVSFRFSLQPHLKWTTRRLLESRGNRVLSLFSIDTQKVVLKVDVHDEKAKQKAMKAVSSLPGINSITMEMKERKMTVIGEVDPVEVVEKLRKLWFAEILTVGPPKTDEKEITTTHCCIGYPCYCYQQFPTRYYIQEENPNACVVC